MTKRIVAKVVSGFSGDPDSRGSKMLRETANIDDLPIGTLVYADIADEPTVVITQAHLDRLEARAEWLEALEQAGVDNWQGWDTAKDIQAEWDQQNES